MVRYNKAQSILDFILAFGAITLLAIGLIRIWIWVDSRYASQSTYFQNSRYSAGAYGGYQYSPSTLALNDDWVFRGQASGTTGSLSGSYGTSSEVGGEGATTPCERATTSANLLREQADDLRDEADKAQNFLDFLCCWDCDLMYLCPNRVIAFVLGIDVDDLEDAIGQMEDSADDMDEQAQSIQDSVCGISTS